MQLLSALVSALGSLEIILPEKHATHRRQHSYNTATEENKQQGASSSSPWYPS